MQVQTTAEISKRFHALSVDQMQFVLDYCQTGLIQKYQTLDVVDYFENKRIWKLMVYDHLGQAFDFCYEICGQKISAVEDSETLGWLTEVSATKIYAALKNGESLTSMYLRVNDIYFDSDTEFKIAEADVVEDPLIRCLYNGEFASYQKAQLRKIKEQRT